MSPRKPSGAPSDTYVGSLVGKSNSDVMPGSDCPLSLRKNPSKFPHSRDHRYDDWIDQPFANRRSASSVTASYSCAGLSNEIGTPRLPATGVSVFGLVTKYSTLL